MRPIQIARMVVIICAFFSFLQACDLNNPIFESSPNQKNGEIGKTDGEIVVTATRNISPTAADKTPLSPTSTIKPKATATERPTPTEKNGIWKACPDSYGSRLHVGKRAYVSFNPPLSNRVRSNPSRGAKVVGMIEPGEKVYLLSGPECADDWVWWKIKSEETGLTGWTSEGDFEDYWLVPLP